MCTTKGRSPEQTQDTTMTKNYAETKATLLVRDHNAYRRMRQTEACADYRTALDNLIRVAARRGWKISYKVSRAGYLTLC